MKMSGFFRKLIINFAVGAYCDTSHQQNIKRGNVPGFYF
mgnify:CR=1 FL=1